MGENLITLGDKIDLKQILRSKYTDDDTEARVYASQVLDITDDVIRAAMPIYEGRLIPLEVNSDFEAFFHTAKGLYKAVCKVVGRDKIENIYHVDLTLTTELKKFQRREFFRLSCYIDTMFEKLTDTQFNKYEELEELPETFGDNSSYGAIIDISGGGLRMTSKEHLEKNTILGVRFRIAAGAGVQEVNLCVKVVTSEKSVNRPELYENRLQYKGIPEELRDLIVKYIFEEQRRIRHKERG